MKEMKMEKRRLVMPTQIALVTVLVWVMYTQAMTAKDGSIEVEFRFTSTIKCMESGKTSVEIIEKSLSQCVVECVSRYDCAALNFRRTYPLCELFTSTSNAFVQNSVQTGHCVYIEKSDMTVTQSLATCECQGTETCDTISNKCVSPVCPKFTLLNGNTLGNMNQAGSRIVYSCDAGYIKDNDKTDITCQTNGSWTHVPRCLKVVYLGCYIDLDPERILNGAFLKGHDEMTTHFCLKYCRKQNAEFALTEFARECFCGNYLLKVQPTDDNECNFRCAGNASEVCGGLSRGSLYTIEQWG